MKKNDLINYIVNNGGATLNGDLEPLKDGKGYMVSIEGKEYTTKELNGLYNKIIEYKEELKNYNGAYVGIWYNDIDGLYYLDISINIRNKRDALKYAKEQRQKAIFDLKTFDSIYLDNYNVEYYSIYTYNNITGDEIHLKQYDSIEELKKDLKIKDSRKIWDTINKHTLLNGLYYIYKDVININELVEQ